MLIIKAVAEILKLVIRIAKLFLVESKSAIYELKAFYYWLAVNDDIAKKLLMFILALSLSITAVVTSENIKAREKIYVENYHIVMQAVRDYNKAVNDYYDIVKECNRLYGHSTAEQYLVVHNQKLEQFKVVREKRTTALEKLNLKLKDGDRIEAESRFNEIDIKDHSLNTELEVHK